MKNKLLWVMALILFGSLLGGGTAHAGVIAPAGISNLTALIGSVDGQVVLRWTATGDDGTAGNITGGLYEIRRTSGGIITNANYDNPPGAWISLGLSTDTIQGQDVSEVFNNLTLGVTWYFAIKLRDDAGNFSTWNSSADVLTVNTRAWLYLAPVAPAGISNLTALFGPDDFQIRLEWTSPGDDGTLNNISPGLFRIKYSTVSVILSRDFDNPPVSSAVITTDIPITDLAPGTATNYIFTGLIQNVTYYFAIKTRDENATLPNTIPGNFSAWNSSADVPAVNTLAWFFNRPQPPGGISNLTALSGGDDGVIRLEWTSPGDNQFSGDIAGGLFQIKYSTVAPIRSADFDAPPSTMAVVVTTVSIPGPLAPNTATNYIFTGLILNASYYFAVKTRDEILNNLSVWNSSSDVATVNTAAFALSPRIPPAGISNLTALRVDDGVIRLSWTSPGDNGTVGTLILGSLFSIKYSTVSILSSGDFDSPVSSLVVTTTTLLIPAAGLAPMTATNFIFPGLLNNVTYFFAIKTRDENDAVAAPPLGNFSVWNSSRDVATVNTRAFGPATWIPPAAISNLTALTLTDGVVRLEWTSPGDDGTVGTITNGQFVIKYSAVSIISSGDFDSPVATLTVTTVTIPIGSLAPLTATNYVIPGLALNVTYYFSIKTTDELLTNFSAWSSSRDVVTVNTRAWIYLAPVPPAAISNLTALATPTDGDVLLQWTSPGDDGTIGNILGGQYEIRYTSMGMITTANYSSPPAPFFIVTIPTDTAPGMFQQFAILGLEQGVTYFFAIKARDENAGNFSSWVSSADVSTVNTLAWARLAVSPAAISNLTALAGTLDGDVILRWSAPGEDGTLNALPAGSLYRIRRSTNPITNFSSANPFSERVLSTQTATVNEPQEITITGLNPGTSYFFAMIVRDDVGMESSWSTGAFVNTGNNGPAQDLIPNAPTGLSVLSVFSSSATLGWTAPAPPVSVDDRSVYRVYSATYNFTALTEPNVVLRSTAIHPSTSTAVVSLLASATHFFRVSAVDLGDQGQGLFSLRLESGVSNSTQTRTTPFTDQIVNLTALSGATSAQIVLEWSWPGVAITTGIYHIRYTTGGIITNGNYDSPPGAWVEFAFSTNVAAGMSSRLDFGVLQKGVTWWFAIKLEDSAGNLSVWNSSHDISAINTRAFYFTDGIAPAQIADLVAVQSGIPNTIRLTWTAVGDDGASGSLVPGSEYRIQWALDQGIFWDPALAQIVIATSGVLPGTSLSTSPFISATTTFIYFRIWAVDEAQNFSIASDTAAAFNTPFSFEIVDSAGDVGQYDSLAIDRSGDLHISYYDQTNGALRYVKRTGGVWGSTITVDSAGNVGAHTALAVDALKNPHISYFDRTNGDLKYARFDGALWSITTVDSAVIVGSFTAIAIDGAGNPHISYYDITNGDLKYARFDGAAWNISVVDSAGDVGLESSIAIDGAGNPNISYFDNTSNDLKYARFDGAAWVLSIADPGGSVGEWTSIALDGQGNPRISYFDATNSDLKYARWDGSLWNLSTVDSAGNVGRWTSIALDGAGNPHISYRDSTNEDFRYARFNGTSWSTSTVGSSGSVGTWTSIAIDGSGDVHISYFDSLPNFDLRVAHWTGVGLPSPMGGNARGRVQGPINFRPTAVFLTSVTWNWSDNSGNELGFRLYGGTGSAGPFSLIASTTSIGAGVTSFTETGLLEATPYFRYIAAVNAGGIVTSSGSFVLTSADVIPPAAISNLTALSGFAGARDGEILLRWTSPGDNGTVGTIVGGLFRIKYSTVAVIRSSDFDSPSSTFAAVTTDLAIASLAPMTATNFIFTGLATGVTYYFSIKTRDENPANFSVWNSSIDVVTVNTLAWIYLAPVAPAAISNLTALATPTDGDVLLQWTSPGDDGTVGNILGGQYEIRYTSMGMITTANYSSPPAPFFIVTIPTDTAPGMFQQFAILGLGPGVTYFFAIKARDENAGNFSSWVSSADVSTVNTLAWARLAVAPGAISNLTALAGTLDGDVDLLWTSPGEDGTLNALPAGSLYRIRRSTVPIGSFATASSFSEMAISTGPVFINTQSRITITGLNPGTSYFFAMIVRDDLGMESSFSTGAFVNTGNNGPAQDLIPNAPTGLSVLSVFSSSATLGWTAPAPPVSVDDRSVYRVYSATYNFTALTEPNVVLRSTAIHPSTSTAVINIAPETVHFFRVTSADLGDQQNGLFSIRLESGVSNSTQTRTTSFTDQIVNLTALTGATSGQIVLEWSWPGVAITTGIYHIRYTSAAIITNGNYDSPPGAWVEVAFSTNNVTTGLSSRYALGSLLKGVTWWFAIKIEETPSGNFSIWNSSQDISNINTLAYYFTDGIAPAQITNLIACPSGTPNTILLTWTAVGDDGVNGSLAPGSEYRIQWALDPGIFWDPALAQIVIATSGVLPGASLSTSPFISATTTFIYFRIWARDEAQNISAQSAVASAFNTPFSLETVVSVGNVGQYNAIAVDRLGDLHVSYYDVTSGDLRYVKRTGAVWGSPVTVDSIGDVGDWTSIAVDALGNPHISYRDIDNFDLKYASSTDGGTIWLVSTVESAGSVGSDTSIALDGAGNPHIAHRSGTTDEVKYARYNGTSWSTFTVDSAGSSGWFTAIAVDGSGDAHFAYHDNSLGTEKYAKYSGGIFLTTTIDSDVGQHIGDYGSIVLDGNGNPHISYKNWTANDLKYARFDGIRWSTFTADTAGGDFTHITLDGDGNPHISYAAGGNLNYARFNGVSWSTQTLDSCGASGQYTSIAIDGAGSVHITYYNTNQDLRAAHWTGAGFPGPMAGNSGGKVQGPNNFRPTGVFSSSVTWSWSDNSGNELGFRLYGGTGSAGPFSLIATTVTIGAGVTSFTETGLLGGNTFFRYVAAVNTGGVVTSSGSFVVTGADTTPPDAISNLTALATPQDGDVLLQWTVPGDDGTVGNISGGLYEIRYTSRGIITSANYASPPTPFFIVTIPTSTAPNLPQSYAIAGLLQGVTYWFAIKARDDSGNWSAWASSADVSGVNTLAWARLAISPGAISNLTALTGALDGDVILRWSAPGEDGILNALPVGSLYRIRRSTNPITNFNTATSFSERVLSTQTAAVNESQEITLTGLNPGASYFFAIIVRDDAGMESSWSTGAFVNTASSAPAQDLIPNAPTGLSVLSVFSSSATLWWTAPAPPVSVDDRSVYRVYSATYNFTALTEPNVVLRSTAIHPSTSTAVINIAPDTAHFFRVSSVDLGDQGNGLFSIRLESALSASTQTKTASSADQIINLTALTGIQDGRIVLEWNWPSGAQPSSIYHIRHTSGGIITNGNYNSPPGVWVEVAFSTSVTAGQFSRVTFDNFQLGATWYFAVKLEDAVGIFSTWNSSADVLTVNTRAWLYLAPVAPAGISNLTALFGPDDAQIRLEWTSPGDDGLLNNISPGLFRIKYSTVSVILSRDFDNPPVSSAVITTDIPIATLAPNTAMNQIFTGLIPNVTHYFAIKTRDENATLPNTIPGNFSAWNSSADVASVNTLAWFFNRPQPPGGISNLTALPGGDEGVIRLEWTSPGDNGTVGAIAGGLFQIKYSTVAPIRSADFDVPPSTMAVVVTTVSIPGPLAPNTATNYIFTGLILNASYYFAVKTRDEILNNLSVWNSSSDVATVNTAAAVLSPALPPAGISNLTALSGFAGARDGEILLRWTSPGDNGTVGTITGGLFRIKYSTVAVIRSSDFDSPSSTFAAVTTDLAIASLAPMTATNFIFTGLATGVTYYFSIKTRDENDAVAAPPLGNFSVWNSSLDVVSVNSQALVFLPPVPPNAISNLTALRGTLDGDVILRWSTPADDGTVGTLPAGSLYRIRRSTNPIPNFASTPPPFFEIAFSTSGLSPGTSVSFVMAGLNPGTSYFFAIIARDDAGAESSWSTGAFVNTASSAPAQDLILSAPTGLSVSATFLSSATLTWAVPPAPLNVDDRHLYRVYAASYAFANRTDPAVFEAATATHPTTTADAVGLVLDAVNFFRVVAFDFGDQGGGLFSLALESPVSNLAMSTTTNSVSPAGISNLTALTGTGAAGGEILLQWTSPGTDGTIGALAAGSQFEIKFTSIAIITAANYDSPPSPSTTLLISTTAIAGSAQSRLITGLVPGASYWFAIKTKDSASPANVSIWNSSADVATVNTLAFAAASDLLPGPPILGSLAAANLRITVNWFASSSPEVAFYRVYRATFQTGTLLYATTPQAFTTFTDTAVTNGIEFFYKITAVDLDGDESIFSSTASGVSRIAAPSGLKGTHNGNSALIAWTDSIDDTASNFVSYSLYRSTLSGGPYVFVASAAAAAISILDSSGVVSTDIYFYVMRSSDTNGPESLNSNEAVVSPFAAEVRMKIGPPGGTLTLSNGTSVTFPPGALDETVIVVASQLDPATVPAGDASSEGVDINASPKKPGSPVVVYSFAVEGFGSRSFKKPVTLVLGYPDITPSDGFVDGTGAPGLDEKLLQGYFHDKLEWRYIGGKVDTAQNAVTLRVNHFTLFALFKQGKLPQAIVAKERFITPNNDGKNESLHFEVEGGIQRIEIYDVTGKRVMRIEDGSLSWPGRDESGRAVESGVYLYKVWANNGSTLTGAVMVAK